MLPPEIIKGGRPIARGIEQDRHGRCGTPRKQQEVALPMIAFGMIKLDIFVERPPQQPLAEQNHLGQTLFFYRSDPPLRKALRFGLRAGRTSGSTWPDAMIARNDWVYLLSRSCRR